MIGHPEGYQKISLGTPTLRTKVTSNNKLHLSHVMDLLAESDPFLEYELEKHSKDIYLNLFGDIQMEIIKSLVKERYGLEIEFSEPDVIYQEMPVGTGQAALYIYTKEHPFAATVGIRVEPWQGVKVTSEVSTGDLPQTFQNGILDGINQCLEEGILGWQLNHIKVTITEGGFNSVDSTPADFRNLSPLVFANALKEAGTKLLWPVNTIRLKIDKRFYGKVMSDLMTLKAYDLVSKEVEDKFEIIGKLPIETSLGYEKQFVSTTSGSGLINQTFYDFQPSPETIKKERPRNNVNPFDKGKYLLSKLRTY